MRVVFEDSAVGIRSAVDGGRTLVAVPQDGADPGAADAHLVLTSLEDVVVED